MFQLILLKLVTNNSNVYPADGKSRLLHSKNKTNQLCVNIFTTALSMSVNIEPFIL